MKRITIGRGKDSMVKINDTTDTVSRNQAVICCNIWGDMKIYDLSKNSTKVNGVKVVKPEGMTVRRGDLVSFGKGATLDWNQVPNPYRKHQIAIISLICVLIAAAFVLVLM